VEQQIRKMAETFGKQFESEDDTPFRPLLSEAIKISNTSLTSFTGGLLEKGLDIARSIAEFDAELQKQSYVCGINAGMDCPKHGKVDP